MAEILIYQQVLICEKIPIQKLVSAGRGRKRRLKVVFKWRCRATMRPKNISEYPIIDGYRDSAGRMNMKLTIIE